MDGQSLWGSYTGHAYTPIMVTERLGLHLFTALHVCWEYLGLVVLLSVISIKLPLIECQALP